MGYGEEGGCKTPDAEHSGGQSGKTTPADALAATRAFVLFPAAGACAASELKEEYLRLREQEPQVAQALAPRIVVLDGGWKETRKMNQSIDPAIPRCFLSNASREEYGGTRKYKQPEGDRVQTAAAFVALLKELGEAPERTEVLQAALERYTEAFSRQIAWSGVELHTRVTLPNARAVAKS